MRDRDIRRPATVVDDRESIGGVVGVALPGAVVVVDVGLPAKIGMVAVQKDQVLTRRIVKAEIPEFAGKRPEIVIARARNLHVLDIDDAVGIVDKADVSHAARLFGARLIDAITLRGPLSERGQILVVPVWLISSVDIEHLNAV